MGQTHKEREKSLEIAQNVDILSVADALGMGLERSGRTYQWSKHDSLKITPSKNSFYWNSRSKGGGSIQLVMAVNECSYKEAVKFINESELSEFKDQALPPEKPFVYFLKEDKDLSKTKDYLINERQLSKETVDFFIEKNVITQGKYKDKINNHEETAIVFKHTDLTGKVKGMSYQGIDAFPEIHGDRLRLKRVYGDGYYGLSVPIGHVPKGKEISIDNPLKIIAFEAPIDLMSYYELNKNNLNNVVLLAMNGFKKGTLSTYIANSLGSNLSDEKKQTFLEDMQKMAKKKVPFIQLTLAVDNDEAGHNFINEFGIDFIDVQTDLPPNKVGKDKSDWNDILKEIKQEKGQKSVMENEKNEGLSDYFQVEFNETNLESGIVSFKGEIVTPDLIEKIKLFDNAAATAQAGYYKFYFDEFINGEKVNHIRMDVGDGVSRNHTMYKYLEEKAVKIPAKEVMSEIKEKEVITEDKGMTINYLVSFENDLKDSLNQMAVSEGPTEHYLTETEVNNLLSTHLDKVDHLIQHFSSSVDQLEKPTQKQVENLQQGLRATIKEISIQFKMALAESLNHKKEQVLSYPRKKAEAIRSAISTSFKNRLLQLNQSIQKLVDTVDKKYNESKDFEPGKEEQLQQTKSENNSPEEEELNTVSELASDEKKVDEQQVPNETVIKLGRDYSLLIVESEELKKNIIQLINKNPLSDISDLQQKLNINQDNIKKIGEKIDKNRMPVDIDKTVTSNIDTVAKLSILVAQRDSLLAERDQWVSHPDFLNRKIESTNLESPLNQFKKCDAQIIAIDKLIVDLQNGKEVNSSEFLQTARVEQLVTKEVINKPVMEQIHAETKDIKREEVLTDSDIKTLTDTVKDQRMMLLNPDVFKKYLDSTTKLHSYSPKNIQLIMSQFPEATQVASENKWKQLGYELTADAKPIHVYAPVVSEGEVDKKGDVQFYLKPVYDVSQTTGKENFQLFQLNENDKEQVSKVIYGLTDNVTNKELINQIPVNSIGKNFNEIMKSYIDLTVEQSLKTTSQGLQRQFEVNAISYVIANHLGLESEKMYSLEELKQFNTSPNSMKNLDNSLKTISKHSDKLVQSINQKVNGKAQQKNKFEERVAEGQAMNKQVERSRPTQEQEQKQSLRR